MLRWWSKGAASWEGVDDANKGEPSFKILIDIMTPSELCMSRIDSTLQHESVIQLSNREPWMGWGVGVCTRTVTPSAIGSSSLSKIVRVGFLFEDESTKCTMLKGEFRLTPIRLSEGISCKESNLRGEGTPRLNGRPHFAIRLEELLIQQIPPEKKSK